MVYNQVLCECYIGFSTLIGLVLIQTKVCLYIGGCVKSLLHIDRLGILNSIKVLFMNGGCVLQELTHGPIFMLVWWRQYKGSVEHQLHASASSTRCTSNIKMIRLPTTSPTSIDMRVSSMQALTIGGTSMEVL